VTASFNDGSRTKDALSIDERAEARESDNGAPSEASATRVLRPRRAAPTDAIRPTRAEINLAHLRHNLRELGRTLANDESPAQIWCVLKADAYGHGAPAVARTLERAGMEGVCVALLEEAIELREAGIQAPILVMGGYFGPSREGIEELCARDLTPVVYDRGQIERIASVVRAEQRQERFGIHLKIDTGMGRLGVSPNELDAVLDALAAAPELCVTGVMTHLACADGPDREPTDEQLRRFESARHRLRRAGHQGSAVHAANSAALLRFPEARFDIVRPGLALFGASPFGDTLVPNVPDFKPVMRVRSEIVALRTIEAGERLGYGHTWTASSRSLIATVPIGYADGLDRKLSNLGHLLVRGRRAPIVGAVSMDLVMLDVTQHPGASIRDEAVFMGAQEGPLGRDAITVEQIAQQTGTVAWEVMTGISRRVPRFYREP